jgi:hypothetical protein
MLPESHGPTILAKHARTLRRQGYYNAFTQEELEPATLRHIIQVHFLRPVSESFHRGTMTPLGLKQHTEMLIYEPISQGAAIWIGLAYGIV